MITSRLISKEEAARLGQKWYFTGAPCRKGHIDLRYVNTDICYACKRKQNKTWSSSKSAAVFAVRKRTYEKHKQRHLQRSREWANKNKERSREIKRKNKLKHKEKYLARERERTKIKRQTDPLYRISRNIALACWKLLKFNKMGRSYKEFISYSMAELKTHLEAQFSEEMSWENYGSFWEIDHIIPVYYFCKEYSDAQILKEAWKLQNLQPLEISLNRGKSHRNKKTRKELLDELHSKSTGNGKQRV